MSAPDFSDDEKRDILELRRKDKSWREIAIYLNKQYKAYNNGARIWRSVQRKHHDLLEEGSVLITVKISVKVLNSAKAKGITNEHYQKVFEKGLASYP
jgi:hypothetical protein